MAYEQEQIDCEQLPRDLQAALTYWTSLCGDRFAPSWREFDLLQLPMPVIPGTFVADVVSPEEGQFRCRFWGTSLTQIFKQDLTNKTILDFHPKAMAQLVHDNMLQTLEAKEPKAYHSEISAAYRLNSFEYLLRIPLSDDGITVHQIVTITVHVHGKPMSTELFETKIRAVS